MGPHEIWKGGFARVGVIRTATLTHFKATHRSNGATGGPFDARHQIACSVVARFRIVFHLTSDGMKYLVSSHLAFLSRCPGLKCASEPLPFAMSLLILLFESESPPPFSISARNTNITML
jgi:hypothetical protein